MYLKNEIRPTDQTFTLNTVKPLMLREVTNQEAVAIGGGIARRRLTAIKPASGTTYHARHPVSRHTQS